MKCHLLHAQNNKPSKFKLILLSSILYQTNALAQTNVTQVADQLNLPPQLSKQTVIENRTLVRPNKTANQNQSKTSIKSQINTDNLESQITVKGYKIASDVADISHEAMLKVLNDGMSKVKTFKDLQLEAYKLENWLRTEHKLFKARVYVPIQDMSNNQVKLVIKQGSIENFTVNQEFKNTTIGNNALLVAKRHLKKNQALNIVQIENMAYRVMDYLKMPVNVVLRPIKTGFYDVLLDIQPKKQVQGVLTVDNMGNKLTNEIKDTLYLSFHNVTGNIDNLYLSTQLLTPNQKIIKATYEKPLVIGQTLSLELLHSSYQLCCEFFDADVKGQSNSARLAYAYHLEKSRTRNQTLTGTGKYSVSKSTQKSQTINDSNIKSMQLGYDFDWSNQRSDNHFDIRATIGDLTINNQKQLNQDKSTAKTHGTYQKVNMGYQMNRPVSNKSNFKIHTTAQWASKNLNSVEKISIGGASALRAMPYGKLNVDIGLINQLEYNHYLSSKVIASLLLDASILKIDAKNWQNNANNSFSIFGAGFGVKLFPTKSLMLEAVVAGELGNNFTKNTGDSLDDINTSITLKHIF